jgi:hypothetical protein
MNGPAAASAGDQSVLEVRGNAQGGVSLDHTRRSWYAMVRRQCPEMGTHQAVRRAELTNEHADDLGWPETFDPSRLDDPG